ncbi:MAG: 3-deoxy-manno-octulosonate cytidylyltransferase [Rickettsiales bacterium]
MSYDDTLIIIPARMASTRLPGKPLADIAGLPMIVQVWKRAMESQAGHVLVACDDESVAKAVQDAGGEAILTRPDHPSGSDRIWEAYSHYDPEGKYSKIINVQGDLPTLDPALINEVANVLEASPMADIATLACAITDENEKMDSSVVKPVISFHPADEVGHQTGRALYFTRCSAPYGEGELYHHIGIYAYRRDSLRRFVALPPSPLEQREKLEQLRALEHEMRIEIAVVDTVPLGVDTPEHLEKARRVLS